MRDIPKVLLWIASLSAAAPLPAAEAPTDGQAKAQITVLVPADAEVFFDGAPTTQKGAERLFFTPPLTVGEKGYYNVTARWNDGGKMVERKHQVEVTSGGAVRVDFLAPEKTGRNAAGKSLGAPGRLFVREGGPGSAFHVVGQGEAVYSGDLLIGLTGDEVESKDGAVHLRLLKYSNSPLPVMEPAVTLHPAGDADLDFSLERGMVEFSNAKPSGVARVRIEARGEKWELVLGEPGAKMLVEFYSGWPKGARFHKNPGAKDAPLARMTFLVLKGQMDLRHDGRQVAMNAPPGPAVIEWDSATGMDDGPTALTALPDWVLPPKDEAGKAAAQKAEDVIGRFASEVSKSKSPDPVIEKFLTSEDPLDRRLAVAALAATDQLPLLGKALRESDRADVWEDAVLALRHWIGRAPGQDQALYKVLIDSKKYTDREAETLLELLHDFGDDDLARPAVYQYLISHLDSDQLFIRGLAYWHLSRLVPEGKKFGYDAHAPKEQREAAVAKWKELIPDGKLPSHGKEGGK